MSPIYRYFFPAVWISWAAYWWLVSRLVKPVARIETVSSRLLHVVPLVLASFLLYFGRAPLPFLNARLYPPAYWIFWTGGMLTVAGLLFTVWARVHLGRNWSGMVTLKKDHELVSDGPYALVRHPIYTGLLLAFAGSALARGDWSGVLAVLIVLAAFWRKLRMEERWMREIFGERYESYCRQVPPLVPFWR